MLARAADHNAPAESPANADGDFLDRGENDHALGAVEQVLGNVIWDVEDLFENDAGILDAIGLPFVACSKG